MRHEVSTTAPGSHASKKWTRDRVSVKCTGRTKSFSFKQNVYIAVNLFMFLRFFSRCLMKLALGKAFCTHNFIRRLLDKSAYLGDQSFCNLRAKHHEARQHEIEMELIVCKNMLTNSLWTLQNFVR